MASKGWIEPNAKTCPCGSGLRRSELHDAKGYFCTFYCIECEDAKRAQFNPDIFTNPNYYTEPGEDDDND